MCDTRDRCPVLIVRAGQQARVNVCELAGYTCGFEQAGTVENCPKRRELNSEETQ